MFVTLGGWLLFGQRVTRLFLLALAISLAGAALLLFPLALGWEGPVMAQSTHGWLILLGLALIPQVAGQSLIAYAMAQLPASLSALSLLVQPVFAAMYAWLMLGEGMTVVQIAGGSIVLAGIYLARRWS